jgi:hypothetical protein
MSHLVRRIVFCLAFACMVGASAVVSFADQPNQAITREDIENRRQEIVVATMKFSDEQLKMKFLEVYVPYQEKLMKIMKGREKLLTQFLQDQKNGAVSDAEASQLLNKSLAFGRERIQAENDYVGHLKKILPAEQVLRAYQIETKLNALYLAVMFDTVPLAR